jgi:hypothetical protein
VMGLLMKVCVLCWCVLWAVDGQCHFHGVTPVPPACFVRLEAGF